MSKNLISKTSFRPGLNWVATLSVLAFLVTGISQLSPAQKSGPETFSSPWKASNALFQAVQNGDEDALERILGVGKEFASSSDELRTSSNASDSARNIRRCTGWCREPDGSTVLYIGAENWPFPIPLVSRDGVWFFDSDTGKEEIMFRTVGENETTALQVCHVLAEGKERSQAAATDPVIEYAQGLVNSGIATSDNAARDPRNQLARFHGYYFRIVTGGHAAGAVAVAYPADYRSSGVMTFMVTKNGVRKGSWVEENYTCPRLKARSGFELARRGVKYSTSDKASLSGG